VVREEETQRLGPVPLQSTEQFVLDRRTARNLDSPLALSEGQHVDRAPFFSSGALPFHAGPGPYEVWKNEVAAPYRFVRTGSDPPRGVRRLHPLGEWGHGESVDELSG
jgi:hypothetical protein